MPDIGVPRSNTQKRLSQVTMRKKPTVSRVSAATDESKDEMLNRLAGNPPKTKVKSIKNPNQIGKDEFLKLLSHQLQNQDPFKPKDQNKFAAELAQFSQLEQLANLNTKFDSMGEGKKLQQKFYAANMVGKRVVLQGSSIELREPGEKVNMLFALEQKASKVLVRIHDKKGNIVQEKWLENVGRGNHSVPWKGMSLDKSYAAPGEYKLSMVAWDDQNKKFPVSTHSTGIVESVSLEGDEPVLNVEGKQVYLRDVKSFHIAHGKNKAHNNIEKQLDADPSPAMKKVYNSGQNKKGQVEAFQKLQSYD